MSNDSRIPREHKGVAFEYARPTLARASNYFERFCDALAMAFGVELLLSAVAISYIAVSYQLGESTIERNPFELLGLILLVVPLIAGCTLIRRGAARLRSASSLQLTWLAGPKSMAVATQTANLAILISAVVFGCPCVMLFLWGLAHAPLVFASTAAPTGDLITYVAIMCAVTVGVLGAAASMREARYSTLLLPRANTNA